MHSAMRRLRAQFRAGTHRLAWWIWPNRPETWAEVPARLRPHASQIARLTIAAVVAYVVADAITPGILDLTAPLTALLVVQASTVGTVQMGLVRVGAVLTGVLVAVGVASLIGLSWWSLGAVIAVSLVLAKVLRLGEQSLETPISAMLILAVSTPQLAAEVRVTNTLIGTVVGIAFSLLVPVSIPNDRATEAVRRVARSQAALLADLALVLVDRAPHQEEVTAWSDWTDTIEQEADAAAASVRAAEESRRFNARALATATVHPGLRSALDRLEDCLAAVRALLVTISRQAPPEGTIAQPDTPAAVEVRRAFAMVLDDLADALRAYGDLVSAEFGGGKVDRLELTLARTVRIVEETRAVLTDLFLLDVDARDQAHVWMLHASVLAAVEHILRQLDLSERSRAAWLDRHPLPQLPLPEALNLPKLSGRSRLRRTPRPP